MKKAIALAALAILAACAPLPAAETNADSALILTEANVATATVYQVLPQRGFRYAGSTITAGDVGIRVSQSTNMAVEIGGTNYYTGQLVPPNTVYTVPLESTRYAYAGPLFCVLTNNGQSILSILERYDAPPSTAAASTTTLAGFYLEGLRTNGTAPYSVQFRNQSANATNQLWTFGDGTTSGLRSPAHIFATGGTFNVTLAAIGTGQTNTITKTNLVVVLDGEPTAAFTASSTNGTYPLTVTFTDASAGTGLTNRSWNFGNGETADIGSNTYAVTYALPSTNTVSLTVFNPSHSNALVRADYVVVTGVAPAAAFAATSTNAGTWPLTVSFTNTSVGTGLTNFLFAFGDGESTNTTDRSLSHTYALPSTNTVSLTAFSAIGSNAQVRADYVVVTSDPPVSIFAGTPTSGSIPFAVVFTNTSTGTGLTNFFFDFGDASGTSNTTDRSVSYTYTNAGTFSVSLTIYNYLGSNALVRTNYILSAPAP